MAQIGTIKVETAGGPVELPVYDLGDSGSNRVEAFRVQTASGPGFVPLTDVSAADRPYLRVQTGNGVKAFDTSASGIPDSGVFRWLYEDDSNTSTATDEWNDNDGAINGASYDSNDSYEGSFSLSLDGNDYVEDPVNRSGLFDGDSEYSIATAVKVNDTTNTNNTVWSYSNASNNRHVLKIRNDTIYATYYDGSFYGQSHSFSSNDTWVHLIMTFSPPDNVTLYVDGSSETGSTDEGVSDDVNPARWGNDTVDNGVVGNLDQSDTYDKELSDTEASNLASSGSI